MDSSTVTGILGIVAAIIFGIPTFLSLRNQIKTRIVFFEIQKLGLYDDLLKNIPDLNITYKGKTIQKGMFILKGIFICIGNQDIVKDDIRKGIMIKAKGAGAYWHDYKILGHTEHLVVDIVDVNEHLYIDFDLLKNEDYIILEGLGESDSLVTEFTHRIAGVTKEISVGSTEIKKLLLSGMKSFFLILAITVLLFWVFNPFRSEYSHMLKPTFYTNSGTVVKEDELFDTVWHEGKVMFNPELLGLDTILVKNANNNISKAKVNLEIDSVTRKASHEYSKLELSFRGETKPYRLNKDFSVVYRSKTRIFESLAGLALILVFLWLIIMLIGISIQFLRYRKIEELATRLIKANV